MPLGDWFIYSFIYRPYTFYRLDDGKMEKSPDSEAERKLVDILLEESRRRQVDAEEELIVLRTVLEKEKQRYENNQ